METLIARYEQDLSMLDSRRREILQTARRQADQLLADANAQIENTIRDYLSIVPGIRRFQDEHVQLGGTGITVVDME